MGATIVTLLDVSGKIQLLRARSPEVGVREGRGYLISTIQLGVVLTNDPSPIDIKISSRENYAIIKYEHMATMTAIGNALQGLAA
jgi:hypothetical protein